MSGQRMNDQIRYQIVFHLKYRRKMFVGGVGKRLRELTYLVAKELSCEVLKPEVMPDPMYMLLEGRIPWLIGLIVI
jgi:REP element-mobilizing transposase RayT